jgi:hypothetical protein
MKWPLQSECDKFYGNPRGLNGQPSRKWETENLMRIIPPYQMFYLGKPVKSLRVHKKCAKAMLQALVAIHKATKGNVKLLTESGANIYAGTYNFRVMRGGYRLSMHSYGCAIDLDPARNGMGNRNPRFNKYPFIIKAFEDQGAVWGGRWAGRNCDGMHFQFARVG